MCLHLNFGTITMVEERGLGVAGNEEFVSRTPVVGQQEFEARTAVGGWNLGPRTVQFRWFDPRGEEGGQDPCSRKAVDLALLIAPRQ